MYFNLKTRMKKRNMDKIVTNAKYTDNASIGYAAILHDHKHQ